MALELKADPPEENVLDRWVGEPVKVCVCVCVCVSVCMSERGREREMLRVSLGLCVHLHGVRHVCVGVCVCRG